VSAVVLRPGIVFPLGFACTPCFLLAILLPAPKVFPSGYSCARPGFKARGLLVKIPDRTGQERARKVLAPVPDWSTGDSAPGFLDLSQASPARSARRFCRSWLFLGLVTPYCSRSGRSSCIKQRGLFCL
jgi:hypothetical protein